MTPEIEQLLRDWPMGYNLKLPEYSTCVIAGMYVGRVAELLEELYQPARIVGYDPQMWALELSQKRSDRLGKRWELVNCAIGVEDNPSAPMGEWHTDACSLVDTESREKGTADVREIISEFDSRALSHIDLCVFNMEGYEWTLLPYMAERGVFSRVDKIAVQFHLLGTEYFFALLANIMTEQGFRLRMDYYPQWVLWEKWDTPDRWYEYHD